MSRDPCAAPDVASVAALIADPSRAAMAMALMDDRARTVGELATTVGVARSTASEHASALVGGGLCEERRQGRHRYIRLASPAVASALEVLGSLASRTVELRPTLRAVSASEALQRGRTCYRHLAGELGVQVTENLHRLGVLSPRWQVTKSGLAWVREFGIAWAPAPRRPLARPCLDWTERTDHLAGYLGDALCNHLLTQGWLSRRGRTRAVALTERGRSRLQDLGFERLP